jgi:hypothetical protein
MNEHLRERILRKLEALSDDRGYQVLDYVEFLESRFAERQQPSNAFTKFSEAIEDRLRAGKVSASAIAETMGLLNRAANVLNGAVAAGKSVANDLVSAAQSTNRNSSGASPASAVSTPASPAQGASSPARDVARPGSGEERL